MPPYIRNTFHCHSAQAKRDTESSYCLLLHNNLYFNGLLPKALFYNILSAKHLNPRAGDKESLKNLLTTLRIFKNDE